MNILLIAGGWSPEREISLIGAAAVRDALVRRGHRVTSYDLSDGFESLLDLAASHDAAFLNLHGAPGEDGLVPVSYTHLELSATERGTGGFGHTGEK